MASSAIQPFQTTFAVPLHCHSCITTLTSALTPLPGLESVSADLATQLVHTTGTTAPSRILSAIQSTGRDAILRGSGKSNSAAVCILETHSPRVSAHESRIRGLARMVQVSEGEQKARTLVDLTVRGVAEGTYDVTVRERGDISSGAASTGAIWEGGKVAFGLEDAGPRGYLGRVVVGRDGKGSAFLDRQVAVGEIMGRAMVVRRERAEPSGGEGVEDDDEQEDDEEVVVGVIARSAGVWDNDKTVCSCSGKTIWEERQEQVRRGIV